VTTLGALVTLWCFADAHADENGVLLGYDAAAIDERVKLPGFCESLPSDWIDISDEWVKLPDYQEHNGSTAKARAQTTKRKRKERSVTDVTNVSRTDRDTSVTREEKRREEINTPVVPTEDASDSVLSAYHRALPNCLHIHVLNDKRKKRVSAAVKLAKSVCQSQGWQYVADDFWAAYFDECTKDAWMRGDVPNPKNANWKQNLDVLIAEDRFAGIMDRAIESMRGAA
jgi:hypothetical protein